MTRSKILTALVVIFFLTTWQARGQTVPSGTTYEEMSAAERLVFVGEQARRIAREMSGTEYEFTPAFEADIQNAIAQYARRGSHGSDNAGKRSLRSVFARGQAETPRLIAAFRARNVSPLLGIYLPWVESEYVNFSSPNSMGAVGMFQFLPATGERYGLSAQELLDVEKSADAAARYISDSLDKFKSDPMKEALALLAYNRGAGKTERDLKLVINNRNKQCSICALTADRSKLDEIFRSENVYYVPRFFAAAIIGENPQVFGLQMKALSSY